MKVRNNTPHPIMLPRGDGYSRSIDPDELIEIDTWGKLHQWEDDFIFRMVALGELSFESSDDHEPEEKKIKTRKLDLT